MLTVKNGSRNILHGNAGVRDIYKKKLKINNYLSFKKAFEIFDGNLSIIRQVLANLLDKKNLELPPAKAQKLFKRKRKLVI